MCIRYYGSVATSLSSLPGWQGILRIEGTSCTHVSSLTDSPLQRVIMTLMSNGVKLTLEEWSLKGTKIPLLVWTDHNNYEYLRMAESLFSRFYFTLSYRPGSTNTQPDSLSSQFFIITDQTSETTILRPQCLVRAALVYIKTWHRHSQSMR